MILGRNEAGQLGWSAQEGGGGGPAPMARGRELSLF